MGWKVPATMPLTEIELKGALWASDEALNDAEHELRNILALLWGARSPQYLEPPRWQQVRRPEPTPEKPLAPFHWEDLR